MAVNIRTLVPQAHSFDELVALGTLTPSAARLLQAVVVSGLNVLVASGTQAGNTTKRQHTPPPSPRSCPAPVLVTIRSLSGAPGRPRTHDPLTGVADPTVTSGC